MKITKIECIPLSMPFAKPVVMSGGAEACSDIILVKMHTDEGIVGIAETGGTSPWYQGESQDSITHNISKVFGPNILLGEDPFKVGLDAYYTGFQYGAATTEEFTILWEEATGVDLDPFVDQWVYGQYYPIYNYYYMDEPSDTGGYDIYLVV